MKLNTMDTFLNGFMIERNGEVITLTPEEMSDFLYLEKATTGRDCLEIYKDWNLDNEENVIIDNMMKDEEICFNIEDEILEIASQDMGQIETDVIYKYVALQKMGSPRLLS